MRKYIIIVSAALGILILLYGVFPYYSIYKLSESLKTGDSYELDKYVNFDSVRSSLKSQVNAFMMEQIIRDKKIQDDSFSGLFSGLAIVFGPMLIDTLVDAYVTPEGISSLIRRLKTKTTELQISSSDEDIDFWKAFSDSDYAFFTNPSTFLIETKDVKFKFKLQEWSWKLTDIYLSKQVLEGEIERKLEEKRLVKKISPEKETFDVGNKRLSFKDLSGSFVNSLKAGKLFVVKGRVTNKYSDQRSFIKVKSNILDSNRVVVSSKIVHAGHLLTDKELPSLSMEEIDKRLGKNKMNTNVLPNSSIPFVVIFNNLPEDMSEFTVEAVSSSSVQTRTRIEELETQLKSVPASEVDLNLRLYKELHDLDPDNLKYIDKIVHYQIKVVEKEIERKERRIKRRIK